MEGSLRGADRFYASAKAKQEALRPQTRAEKLIERANVVSIFDVLDDFFGLTLPRSGDSYKSYCPFGYEHADGGKMDKGWRTYPASNSSYCFPMHGLMTPVRLIQNKYSLRAEKAAVKILNNYGLLKPKHYKGRYRELLVAQEQARANKVGNPQHAVEALQAALKQDPAYMLRQFDTDVVQAMNVVLERLNEVAAQGDPDAVREWYVKAKAIMVKIIGGRQ